MDSAPLSREDVRERRTEAAEEKINWRELIGDSRKQDSGAHSHDYAKRPNSVSREGPAGFNEAKERCCDSGHTSERRQGAHKRQGADLAATPENTFFPLPL